MALNKCEICGREHPYVFDYSMEGEEGSGNIICPTCFLLASPTYNQLKGLAAEDINKSKYPSLNMYLYKTLCDKYSMPLFGKSENSDTSSQKKKASGSKASKEKEGMLINLQLYPHSRFSGRTKDIKNIFNILGRKNKRNPLILGAPGTGKTAIVHHISKMISENDVPDFLKGKTIYELNVAQVISGTKYRGDLEEKFSKMLANFDSQNSILFIDDISSITTTDGNIESNTDIGHLLKPYITNENIQIIGTSNVDDYRMTIEANKSLSRLFQPVYLEDQSISEVKEILKDVAAEMSNYHNIEISESIINDCVSLADQYIKYRNFPDKAIDLLDMACSKKKNSCISHSSKFSVSDFMTSRETQEKLDMLPSNVDLTSLFSGSPAIKKKVAACSNYLQNEFDIHNIDTETEPVTLSKGDLFDIVEFWTKIPVKNVSGTYKEQLRTMAPSIKSRVIGQDTAVDAVVAAICRRKLGISRSKRPASFIFVGETGVGKTELAKALTVNMFGSESKMIRFDMSEYMESHSVSKLIGAPPGYVGYSNAGQLTEALKRNPFSVVLFDEIEKAHPDVANILLQVLDDGRITDSKGELIDATNAIIILTSNAGANLDSGIGFGKSGVKDQDVFKKGLMSSFKPEFLGRVDGIITFNTLTDTDYEKIAMHYVDTIVNNLNESEINFSYSSSLIRALCQKANTAKFHAREIARTVTKYVEDAIAEAILSSEDKVESIRMVADNNDEIKVLLNDDAYSIG